MELSCKQLHNYSIDTIDYVTRIGNSHIIVIVDFATAHPDCDFLPNFVQDSQLFSPKENVEDSLE